MYIIFFAIVIPMYKISIFRKNNKITCQKQYERKLFSSNIIPDTMAQLCQGVHIFILSVLLAVLTPRSVTNC